MYFLDAFLWRVRLGPDNRRGSRSATAYFCRFTCSRCSRMAMRFTSTTFGEYFLFPPATGTSQHHTSLHSTMKASYGLTTMMDTSLASIHRHSIRLCARYLHFRLYDAPRSSGTQVTMAAEYFAVHGQTIMVHVNAYRERDNVEAADALWEERGSHNTRFFMEAARFVAPDSSGSGLDRSNISHPLSPGARALMYMSISSNGGGGGEWVRT